MLNKYIKRGLIIGMVVLAFLVLAYLLGIKTYSGPKKETSQVYQRDFSILRTSETVRLSHFESTLKKLQQFGGGEVIFQGGKGFVRFRVRKDGSLVVMVPTSVLIPHILSTTWIKWFLSDKYKYHTIRLTPNERKRLEQMAPLQDATERKVAYRRATPHIFIEAELGSDISGAAELAESILTEVFHVGAEQVTIYAGDYHEFRSSAPIGR